jgi:hypothetical protein
MGCNPGNGMRLPGCVCSLEVAKSHQEESIRARSGGVWEIIIRFLIGAFVVSPFALISDMLKPNWKGSSSTIVG